MSSSSSALRRTLVTLTALALGGSALAVGAGPASAAPADPDITGTVVNASGVGVPGVEIDVYTTPADGSAPRYVGDAFADAAGNYSINFLDPASLAEEFSSPAVTTETEFKLYFNWYPNTPADYHSTGYLSRGLGGTVTVRAAGSVVVPSGGTVVAPTQALPTAGGVLVQVLGASGAPVTNFGGSGIYEPDSLDPINSFIDSASTGSDDNFYPDTDADGDPNAPQDGLVYLRGVEPGEYAVEAYGSDYDPINLVTRNYLSRFFGGNGTYTKATPVKVSAGAFTPLTVQLTDQLTALEEPRIIGNSSFGSTLKADPGTWSGPAAGNQFARDANTDYAYQWLRGSTVVGTGPTYKVTKKDKKSKIRLAVTAFKGDFVGTVVTDPTSKVGEKSRVKVKSFKAGKVTVSVTVAKKKLAKKLGTPTGKVVLLTEDGAVASKKARLKGGQATLSVKAKYAGEKLTVVYLGNKRLGSDTAAVKGGKKKKG